MRIRDPPGWPLEVLDDVALDGYIRATSYVRAIAPPGSALVSLGEELLKDRQDRQIQQFTVRYGVVHLRDVHRGITVYVASPAPRISRDVFAVVHCRHVRTALHVFQSCLMSQLRTGVTTHPACDAVRALDYGVAAPDMQSQALLP